MAERGERHVRAEKPQAIRRRPIQERLARGHRDRRFGVVGERPFGVRKRKRVVMDRIHKMQELVTALSKDTRQVPRGVAGHVENLDTVDEFFPGGDQMKLRFHRA